MTHRPAFAADEHADLTQASDGISRYGAYLAQHRHLFYLFGEDEPPTDDTPTGRIITNGAPP